MQRHRRRIIPLSQLRLEPLLLGLQVDDLLDDGLSVDVILVHDHLQHALQLALDCRQIARQPAAPLSIVVQKPLTLDAVGLDRLGHDVGCQQMIAKSGQNAGFDLIGLHRPGVGAGTGVLQGRASHALVVNDNVAATATAALEQA